MPDVIVAQRMWQRRDTAANWTTKNPVLAAGEIGVETNGVLPVRFKIGNGTTTWTALGYYESPASPATRAGFQFLTTGTTVTIGSGEAYIESLGRVVRVTTSTTISLTRAANTIYYFYLDSAGVIQRDTVAPAAPYFAGARSATSNTARRFLFAVTTRADATYNICAGDYGNNQMYVAFLHNVGASSRLVTAATAASATFLSAAAYCPPNVVTSLRLRIQVANSSAMVFDAFARYYCWTGSAFTVYSNLPFQSIAVGDVPCDSVPRIQYDCTGGAITIDLLGYSFAC